MLNYATRTREEKIVSKFRDIYPRDFKPSAKRLRYSNNYIDCWMISAPSWYWLLVNSIGCYFICSREDDLIKLRERFESGVMKNVLEEIFTLLSSVSESVVIHCLRWDSDEYLRSIQQLRELRTIGECFFDLVVFNHL
jgi:hypothetical protein